MGGCGEICFIRVDFVCGWVYYVYIRATRSGLAFVSEGGGYEVQQLQSG